MTPEQRSTRGNEPRIRDGPYLAQKKQIEDDKTTPLIIGCGITGPVLAMSLNRVGFTPTVNEAPERSRDEEGAFLELAPLGVNVLKELGITDDDIQAAGGFSNTGIVFVNSAGRRIGELEWTERGRTLRGEKLHHYAGATRETPS